MSRALISVPARARRGDVIEIKILISHPMETGYRRDNVGKPVPRNIINRLVCTYGGAQIFAADLYPAMAANPFLSFFTVAADSGEIAFHWIADDGESQTETKQISVT
jgi:sulfur-oxidizing protein SoxZ